MIKVIDNFTEGRPYREFVIGLIGSAIVAIVLFFIMTYGLMFIGFMRTPTGLDLTKNMSVFHAILNFWGEISPQLALLAATVIFSMLQYYVSRRTIGVLPRHWLYATVAAFVVGLVLILPEMHTYAYTVKSWQVAASATRAGAVGGIPFSTTPLFIVFSLIAIAQGASLVRHGMLNALLWSLGSLFVLFVVMVLHRVHAYPLVQVIFAALLCYRYWRQQDPRKSKSSAI